jgi:UDP-4-amino-4,6-dideoxy-N-acetyl-beta-L-altrosamine N-acetyltransferase
MVQKINFIDLDEAQIRLVLSWRNDEAIKKWMHSKETISLNSHLDFIKTLKGNKTKDYFLIKEDDEYLGVIDLTNEYLGIYANPQKKRVGDVLLAQIIDFAFNEKKIQTLKAQVYEDNIKAIKLYTRFHFQTTLKEKNLLTMELYNENR